MQVKILVFGKLVDITGLAKLTIGNVSDTHQLNQELQSRFPALKDYPYLLAVDKEIIHSTTLLNDQATVALLPPYAGG